MGFRDEGVTSDELAAAIAGDSSFIGVYTGALAAAASAAVGPVAVATLTVAGDTRRRLHVVDAAALWATSDGAATQYELGLAYTLSAGGSASPLRTRPPAYVGFGSTSLPSFNLVVNAGVDVAYTIRLARVSGTGTVSTIADNSLSNLRVVTTAILAGLDTGSGLQL